MNTLAFVEAVRNKYVAALRDEIRARREEGELLGAEVAVRPESGPGQPVNIKVIRFDLMTGTEAAPQPSMLMGEHTEGPQIGAIQAGVDELIEVAIHPFLWEACRVWLRHADPDWTTLHAWFDKWMDLQGSHEPDAEGLLGATHFFSEPITEGGGYLFEIDFGSAPVAAFVEMLDVLAQMGAREVRVGISDGSEMDDQIAEALMAPNLTVEQLTKLVGQLIGALEEVESVESPEPLVLKVKAPGVKEPFLSNLHNLWLVMQRTDPARRPAEVGRFIRGHRESHQIRASGTKPDLSSLRPVIKPVGFIEHVRQFAQQRAKEEGTKASAPLTLICRPLVGDLWVACVWDRPNGMQFVTGTEPEEFGLSEEETLKRSVENFLATRPPVELTKQNGVTVARTHDNYDASLLLDDGFWEEMEKKMPGTLLACAPTRDVVLMTVVESLEGVLAMQQLAHEFSQSGNHSISTTVLRRDGAGWAIYKTAEVATEPAVAEKPAPKGPWWKFW